MVKMNKFLLLSLMLIFMLSSLTYGVTTNVYNPELSSSFADTNTRGFVVVANYDLTILNVTKKTGDGATRLRLINFTSKTVINTYSFTGDIAIINYDLNKGDDICIDTDDSGASYTGYYNNSGSSYFPIYETGLNFTNSYYSGCNIVQGTQKWTVLDVLTTDEPVPPVGNMTNFTVTLKSDWSDTSLTDFNITIDDQVELGLNTTHSLISNSGSSGCLNQDQASDGNFSTASNVQVGGVCAHRWQFNKTETSTSAKITIKDGDSTRNVTLPSECFNEFSDDVIEFKVVATDTTKVYNWTCSGSGSIQINLSTGTDAGFMDVYDSGVIWLESKTLNDSGTGSINTLIASNSTDLINFTINKADWFSTTYLNYNVSTDLTAKVNQSYINLSFHRIILNNTISNFSVKFNGTLRGNTTGDYVIVSPDAGNHEITVIDNTGIETYTLGTPVQTFTALQNESQNLELFGHFIIVTAEDIRNGSTINTFNVTIEGIDVTDNRSFGTTTGQIDIPAVDGNYNITIDAAGYGTFNNSQTVNVTNDAVNYTVNFKLYTTNSVNITFYDINTNEIVDNQTITVEFIGASSSTVNTSTGSLYIDLLTPSDYTIIYNADNYRQGSYILPVTNRSFNSLSLYLTPENETSLVLITVNDKFSKDPVINSLVTIQRYVNDAWITDQILKTDFNGQTEGYFVLSTEFYNFLVEKDGTTFFGVVNSNENKKSIYAEDVNNGITIEIDSSPDNTINTYQNTYDIVTSCSFTNTSNTTGYFIFTYDDTANIQHDAVLNVTYSNKTVVCTNTVSSSESANMNCIINHTLTGISTYYATGYLDGIRVDFCSSKLGTDDVLNFNWDATGFFLGLFLVIISLTMFATTPSLSLLAGAGAFSLSMVLNLMFGNTPMSVILLFLFGAFLLSSTSSKSGVNS